jgi:hypothetical protein
LIASRRYGAFWKLRLLLAEDTRKRELLDTTSIMLSIDLSGLLCTIAKKLMG